MSDARTVPIGRSQVAYCGAAGQPRARARRADQDRAAGTAGLTQSDLIRRTQFLDKRQREEVMASLVEAGLVATVMKPTATKPALAYRAVEGGAS